MEEEGGAPFVASLLVLASYLFICESGQNLGSKRLSTYANYKCFVISKQPITPPESEIHF